MTARRLRLSCAAIVACASCTQDFDAFTPTEDAAIVESAADAPAGDVTVEASADTGVKDAAPDVPDVIVDAPQDAPVACNETGAITFNGHCYYLVATTATKAVAATGCANAGAHLVTITTAGEQAAVIVLGSGSERWTDLVHNGNPVKDSNYAWGTGESRNGFNAWSPGEPNGTGQCGSLLGTGLWNDQDCSISLASICERQ